MRGMAEEAVDVDAIGEWSGSEGLKRRDVEGCAAADAGRDESLRRWRLRAVRGLSAEGWKRRNEETESRVV